jgi:hypothetical protein
VGVLVVALTAVPALSLGMEARQAASKLVS